MLIERPLAVFARRELRRVPFARIDAQLGTGNVLMIDYFDRASVGTLDQFLVGAGIVRNFQNLVGVMIGLGVPRASVGVEKFLLGRMDQPRANCLAARHLRIGANLPQALTSRHAEEDRIGNFRAIDTWPPQHVTSYGLGGCGSRHDATCAI